MRFLQKCCPVARREEGTNLGISLLFKGDSRKKRREPMRCPVQLTPQRCVRIFQHDTTIILNCLRVTLLRNLLFNIIVIQKKCYCCANSYYNRL